LTEQSQVAGTIEQNTYQASLLQRKTDEMKKEHEETVERINQKLEQVEIEVQKFNFNFGFALKTV